MRLVVYFCLYVVFGAFFAKSGYTQQPQSPLLRSFERYEQLRSNTSYNLQWVHLGPVVNSARVEAVQAHPDLPGTMYAAFGSGNLWKTTNAGQTWKPIFENQAALGIGDIALAPSNPEIIYVGTGESLKKARNFTMPGTGVYRSNDGGESWNHLGLEDSWHIGELVVHPEDPDYVLVAVQGHFWSPNPNRGVYLTEDGGKTWQHVLAIDDKTGANDIVFAPSDPAIVYASMWENYPDVKGANSAVYRSADAGKTWTKLSTGFPVGNVGRIGLAVSYQDPDKAYALVDNLNREATKATEIYRTVDGHTWKKTHETDFLFSSRIGWYFADIYISPDNDNEFYGLGVNLAHSTDGGKSYEKMAGRVHHFYPAASKGLHLDHCELWINPENPDHLILGNDGGLYVSVDRGASWMHYNNIPAGEFYDIALDTQDDYLIYGGVQDDATVYGPAREWIPGNDDDWNYLWIDAWDGGDGCVTQIDPKNPEVVYFSMQNGAIRRREMRHGKSKSIRPVLPDDHTGKLAYNFIAPYFISPHDHRTLYHAGNYVFKTTNRGDDWKVISPDLNVTGHEDKRGVALGALTESPMKPGLLFAGGDKGSFWVTKDDGTIWVERSEGLADNYIRSIAASRHDPSVVYVAMTGINYDELGAYLYKSDNQGVSWRSIAEGLPDEPVNVIMEDPVLSNVLYAGAYRGVYISIDYGNSWQLLGKNMPAASVADLDFDTSANDLIAATHGRGIYKMNVRALRELSQLPQEQNHLITDPVFYRPRFNDTHRELLPSTIKSGNIWLHLAREEPYKIALIDAEGNKVWDTAVEGVEGINQFRFNLEIDHKEDLGPYFIHNRIFAKAGNYTIEVTGEGWRLSRPVKVVNQ